MFSKSEHCVSSMHWENSQVFLGGSHDNTTHAQAAHFLFAATNYYERLLNNVLQNINVIKGQNTVTNNIFIASIISEF